MPTKSYLCGMSLDKGPTVTDALEAIRALREELTSVKDELSNSKNDVSYLIHNNTHLVVENKSFKAEVTQFNAEIEKLGDSKVEKDSTNSSIPPTQQSITGQGLCAPFRCAILPAGQAVVRKGTLVMNWPKLTIRRGKRSTV